MAWWKFAFGAKTPIPHVPETLTASVATVPGPDANLLSRAKPWQDEAWGYYDTLGEYNYAVTWKAAMLSRVRLVAAEIVPGQDEPVRSDDETAQDILARLSGGPTGQSQMMSNMGVQLDIPGECFLVGETLSGTERWTVRSTDEVRVRRDGFEVVSESSPTDRLEWRPVGDNALVIRVYRPHKRWSSVADSPARAARGTMRELELVNRHILAQYLSRIASSGMVVFPDEVTFPTREEFADAPDPFVAEWIEQAATAIREPGTASGVVPMPIKVPGEYVDKVRFVDFTTAMDSEVIAKRDSAIKRLATQVNIPAEVLLGMGDVNHWGAWQIEEGAIKTSIAPDAEMICDALTTSYLQPRMRASGVENPERFVVWYDLSELSLKPDRSDDAILLYDRMEIDGDALRRETGFDESDKPEGDELNEQALKLILRSYGADALTALADLTGGTIKSAPVSGGQQPAAPSENPPGQERQAPPQTTPEQAAKARIDRASAQAQAPHAVRFGIAGRTEVLHPAVCEKHAYSCPFTHASLKLKFKPGTSGTYVCTLDTFGRMRVGVPAPNLDSTRLLATGGFDAHRLK